MSDEFKLQSLDAARDHWVLNIGDDISGKICLHRTIHGFTPTPHDCAEIIFSTEADLGEGPEPARLRLSAIEARKIASVLVMLAAKMDLEALEANNSNSDTVSRAISSAQYCTCCGETLEPSHFVDCNGRRYCSFWCQRQCWKTTEAIEVDEVEKEL